MLKAKLQPVDRARRFHRARVDHATSLRGGLLAAWCWILAELDKADPDAAGPVITETKAHLVRVAEGLNQCRGARPVPDREKQRPVALVREA